MVMSFIKSPSGNSAVEALPTHAVSGPGFPKWATMTSFTMQLCKQSDPSQAKPTPENP